MDKQCSFDDVAVVDVHKFPGDVPPRLRVVDGRREDDARKNGEWNQFPHSVFFPNH